MLKTSVRNCNDTRSLIFVCLSRAKSARFTPGPTIEFRPALPKAPLAGRTNAAALNQPPGVLLATAFGSATTLGRSFNSPVPLTSAEQKGVPGTPVDLV